MSVYDNLNETQQFACRVIADHARSTAFAIGDGILPGNEGRNYVLRKIMRRAIYHGREHLGYKDPFFYKVCDFVVEQMREAYPELEVQREFIGKMVRLEEKRFGSTLTAGMDRIEHMLTEMISVCEKTDALLASIVFDNNVSRANAVMDVIDEIEADDLEAYGRGGINDRLANFIYKYKLPPFVVFSLLDSEKINLPIPEKFEFRIFRQRLYRLFDQGTPEEKAFASKAVNVSSDQKVGMERLVMELDVKNRGSEQYTTYNFQDFAKLYDTFGYPKDLIRVGLENYGFEMSEAEFDDRFEIALEEIQRQTGIGQTERKSQINPIYAELLAKIGSNRFHGYDSTQIEETEVIALVRNEEQVEEFGEGDEGLIVLSDTPFYAEAGGQVGDTGILAGVHPPATAGGTDKTTAVDGTDRAMVRVKVIDTFAPISGLILHKSRVEKGSVRVGDKVSAVVDVPKRDATRRNHTATHLVHAALREVLGTHVKQAGSVVAPNYLRFDFTHYQPISESEFTEVEDLVNRHVLENHPVNTNVMSIEEAMSGGAMALFGEKYGADVRVLSVGEGVFSKELCGGTHVRATGDIGSFKIMSDEAVASGVRRIRAITGIDAFERFREDEKLIERSLGALKTQRDNLPNAIERLHEELKRTRKENDELKLKIATGAGGASSNGDEAKDIGGVMVLGKIVEGLDANGTRQLSDTLLNRLKSGVVILGRSDEGKASIIVRVSNDLTERIKAGNVIKEIAPIIGGRGGGKADMAEGGGSEPEKLSEAVEAAYGVIEKMIA